MKQRINIKELHPEIPDHVANKIGILWGNMEAMENYLNTLFSHERDHRAGFPEFVFKKLLDIQDAHRKEFGEPEVRGYDLNQCA